MRMATARSAPASAAISLAPSRAVGRIAPWPWTFESSATRETSERAASNPAAAASPTISGTAMAVSTRAVSGMSDSPI